MTTVDIPVGTPVFVRWYGKIVQGETIDREGHCNPPFTDFIPVSMEIPSQDGTPIVPGIRNICMFHMRDVYASAEEAAALPSPCAPSAAPLACVPTSSDHSRPLPTPSTKSCPSEAWLAIQKFKEEHWDHEHNRLHLYYWPEFDRMYHAYQRKRRNIYSVCKVVPPPPKRTAVPVTSASVKPKRTVTVTELSLF